MFKMISFPKRRRNRSRGGWTLLETMMAMVGGSVVLGSILATGNMVNSSMAAIVNYNELSRYSRNTLDTMTRDLRNTAVVTAINDTSVTVSNSITGDTVSYAWDGHDLFTRTYNGARQVMLHGCDALVFHGYQRNPTNDLQFLTASTPSQVKLISVSWRCSRTILGAKVNTESVQTAQICIRN